MPQLPLYRRHIAGLLHNEHPHAVPGRVRGLVLIDPGKITDLIPHRIDHLRGQSTITVGIGGRREKQGMTLPFLQVLFPLLFEIVNDRGKPLPADRIRLNTPALLYHRQNPLIKIDIHQIQAGDRRPSHPGFNEGVDDRPIPVGAKTLALRWG